MSEYTHTITVNSDPKRVFAFVSDINNLPRYLPTVTHAMPQGPERVRVQGEAAGHQYDSDGYYRVNTNHMRMDWGSDGENQYRGWLEVQSKEGESTSTVRVHLSFEPRPDLAEQYERQSGNRHRTIQEGVENALQSIKNICEGQGGKVESRAA